MSFRLTSYGRRELAMATAAFVLLTAGLAALATFVSAAFWAVLAVPLAVWVWAVAFFRDPDRTPLGEGILCPADGRVADITPVGPDSPLGEPGVRIGVFMSVFNVHVNRSPADATVRGVQHQPGAFLDARDPMAAEKNESATIHLAVNVAGRDCPLVVRQVAGKIARRIVTDLAAGEKVRRGQRFGMIKFGSRLEVLVPASLGGQVRVRLGQAVRAGATVLVEVPADADGAGKMPAPQPAAETRE